MRLPNPYTLGAGLLVLLLIVVAIGGVGRRMGVKAEAKRVGPVIEKLIAANKSLEVRNMEIEAAVREANAKVAEEAARAAQHQARGAQAVAEAKEAQRASKGRVAALNRALERERSTCSEAEIQMCGVRLQ